MPHYDPINLEGISRRQSKQIAEKQYQKANGFMKFCGFLSRSNTFVYKPVHMTLNLVAMNSDKLNYSEDMRHLEK